MKTYQGDGPTRLKDYLRKERGSDRDRLSAYDFRDSHNLKIDFEDGSYALFLYALYLVDQELNEMAVFTEHCGYHIFHLPSIRFELVDSKSIKFGPKW